MGEAGGTLVFRVAVESPVSDTKLKEFIALHTKLSVKVRFDVSATASEVEEKEDAGPVDTDPVDAGKANGAVDEPAEQAKTAEQAKPTEQTKTPSPVDPADFTARLRAVKSDLDKLSTAETSVTVEAKALFLAIVELAKDKKIADAASKLGRLSDLVKKGLEELSNKASKASPTNAPKATNAPNETNATDPAVALAVRLKPIKAKMDEAILSKTDLGEKVKSRASEMAVFCRKKDYAAANCLLDQIEQLLAGGPSQQAVSASHGRREKFSPLYLKRVGGLSGKEGHFGLPFGTNRPGAGRDRSEACQRDTR